MKKLSNSYHQRLLGWEPVEPSQHKLEIIKANLEPFGLQDAEYDGDIVELPLPQHWGTAEQCLALATKGNQRYQHQLSKVLDIANDVPRPPLMSRPGWSKYNGSAWVPGTVPEGSVGVLDFEAALVPRDTELCQQYLQGLEVDWTPDKNDLVTNKWLPTVCCIRTTESWFIWVNDFDRPSEFVDLPDHCIWVGFNVPYDRQYVRGEYRQEPTGTSWFDLMSAWIATRGAAREQRSVLNMATEFRPEWAEETAPQSLSAVHEFYTGQELDKGVRDQLIAGGFLWTADNVVDVLRYCLTDIISTKVVFQHLYPEYLVNQPSDVTQLAHQALGSVWLPLSQSRFPGWAERTEEIYQTKLAEIKQQLVCYATKVAETPESERSVQLNQLDWTAAKSGKNKGKPKWLRTFQAKPSLHSQLLPYVLEIHYCNQPLLWDNQTGWNVASRELKHPDGNPKLTDVMVKGFSEAWETGVFSCANDEAAELVKLDRSLRTWVSLRKRAFDIRTDSPDGFPVVLPQLSCTGTITRRATDKLWQVASNPKKSKLGTEIKSMIEAPPGFSLVGADIDGQEIWLAAALGDLASGISGSQPISRSVLTGSKAKKTDIMSVMAAKTEMSRDAAKTLVYGCTYGMGGLGCRRRIQQSSPGLTSEQVVATADKFLAMYKGTKSKLTSKFIGGLASSAFNAMTEIISEPNPVSPILGNRIPRSLANTSDYQPTRMNWTVQTSGVDMRDLWLVLLDWTMAELGVSYRLLMTIHDELWVMVPEGQEYQAAYGFQLTHVLVRAIVVSRLGLDCIPAGIAWHSAVNVDKVMRKDANDPQVTPSQPEPIKPGLELSAKDVLDWIETTK